MAGQHPRPSDHTLSTAVVAATFIVKTKLRRGRQRHLLSKCQQLDRCRF